MNVAYGLSLEISIISVLDIVCMSSWWRNCLNSFIKHPNAYAKLTYGKKISILVPKKT